MSSKPARWKCDFCSNKYPTLEEAAQHEEICPKSPKRKRPPRWACDYCFNAFPSFEAASEHEKTCPQNHSAKRSRIEPTTSSDDAQSSHTQPVEQVWVASIIHSIDTASSISQCEEIASHLDELLGQLKEKTRQKIQTLAKDLEKVEI